MQEYSNVMSFWIRLFLLACIAFWTLMGLAVKRVLLAKARVKPPEMNCGNRALNRR